MNNLDEARRLLSGDVYISDYIVKLSTAHSLLSIAESLERISTMPEPTMVEPRLLRPRVICCNGTPTGKCTLCGCAEATEFFSRWLCKTHQLDKSG